MFEWNNPVSITEMKDAKSTRDKEGSSQARKLEYLATQGCDGCKCNKNTNGKLKATGEGKILIVMESPTIEMEKSGTFVTGKGVQEILAGLSKAKIPARDVVFTAITQCHVHKDIPLEEVTASCRERVKAEIIALKPAVVVGIGYKVADWFLNPVFKKAHGIQYKQLVRRFIPWELEDGKEKHQFALTFNFDPYTVMAARRSFKGRESPGDFDPTWNAAWREIAKYPRKVPQLIKNLDHKNDPEQGLIVLDGTDRGALTKWIDHFVDQPNTAFDFETSSLLPFTTKNEKIYSCAISDGVHHVAFPLMHPHVAGRVEGGEDWQTFSMREMKRYLCSDNTKYAHNLRMEGVWALFFFGRDPIWDSPKGSQYKKQSWERFGDTMALVYTLRDSKGVASLGDQSILNFMFDLKGYSNLDVTKLLQYPMEKVLRYNALDSKFTMLLRNKLVPEVAALPGGDVVYNRYIRTALGCTWMQFKGIPIDRSEEALVRKGIEEEVAEAIAAIRDNAHIKAYQIKSGNMFTPGSSKVVRGFFEANGYDLRTDLSDPYSGVSTDKNTLRRIVDDGEDHTGVAELVLAWRSSSDLLSKFLDKLDDPTILYSDGLLHPSFDPYGTATGRLASFQPNAQNLPKRGKGVIVRKMIKAPEGTVLVAADEGRVEAVAVAVLSGDKVFINLSWDGGDIHGILADKLANDIAPHLLDRMLVEKGFTRLNIPKDQLKKLMKVIRNNRAKGVTFATIYGAGAKKVAKVTGLSTDEAKAIQDYEWQLLPEVKQWQTGVLTEYETTGMIQSPITFKVFTGVLSFPQRVNMVVQNLGALFPVEAMYLLAEAGWWVFAQIHDDLSAIVPKDRLEEYCDFVARVMTVVPMEMYPKTKAIPWTVEIAVGENYCDMNLPVPEGYKEVSSTKFGHTRE